MPCYFTYTLYTETVDSDRIEYLIDAANALGYSVTPTSSGYRLGEIDAVLEGSDYKLSSRNTFNNLMQEFGALSTMANLALQGVTVDREDVNAGTAEHKIRLVVTQ